MNGAFLRSAWPYGNEGILIVTNLAEPRPWKQGALCLLGLGILFFSSYNAANWLASQRNHVPTLVFAWESLIPYWPWTIVPYWSIDLFYVASLFVCTTKRELHTHAYRLLAIQLISVAFFVLTPLRYTFVRPETTGIFGAMLDALLLFDKPFNQAPALHISLLVILWVCFAKHFTDTWRWLLHAWFALIGVSVVTTYQHHFFDVPTGLWAGWFCVWLFPEREKFGVSKFASNADPHRARLAVIYFTAALLVGVAGILVDGWGLWLLWVAGALLLVSLIYGFLDATAFQKDGEGRISMASFWLLAPYRLGAWANSRWWTRHQPNACAITPEVWIGRMPGDSDTLPPKVYTLIDLCAELPCHASSRAYQSLPALDLIPLTTAQLEDAAKSIARAVARGPVMVCCALGYSRSAAAVAAWLIASDQVASAHDAAALIRTARPQVKLHAQQCQALDNLARAHR